MQRAQTAPTDRRPSPIVADARFAYPSFEAVTGNIDNVRQAFEIGTGEIGQRMSMQVRDAIKSSRHRRMTR